MILENLLDESVIFPKIQRLQECLCEELEKAGGPGLCFCGLSPGGVPPFGLMKCEGGDCGVAWVSIQSILPTAGGVETLDGLTAQKCGTGLAARVQVGVARCAPRPRGRGGVLDEQDTFNAVRLYMSDMAAVKRALLCCFGANRDNLVALEGWEPLEPAGGVSGGVWTAVIA